MSIVDVSIKILISSLHYLIKFIPLSLLFVSLKRGPHPAMNVIILFQVIIFANVNMSSPVRPSVCLSVVCNVRTPYSGDWNFRQYFYAMVPWPTNDIQVKFYGDRPRETPPSRELNTRGVAAHLIRIKYPLSSFNYRFFGTNIANFNKIHHVFWATAF